MTARTPPKKRKGAKLTSPMAMDVLGYLESVINGGCYDRSGTLPCPPTYSMTEMCRAARVAVTAIVREWPGTPLRYYEAARAAAPARRRKR